MPPTKRNYGPCGVCIHELTQGLINELSATTRWIQVKEDEAESFIEFFELEIPRDTRIEACGKHMKQWNETKKKTIEMPVEIPPTVETFVCPARPNAEPCRSGKVPTRKANARNEEFLGVPAETKICTDCYFRFITFKRKKEAQEKREKAKKQKLNKMERGSSPDREYIFVDPEEQFPSSVSTRTRSKATRNEDPLPPMGLPFPFQAPDFGLLPFLIAVGLEEYEKVYA